MAAFVLKHFMLADEDAWKLFSKYLEEEDA